MEIAIFTKISFFKFFREGIRDKDRRGSGFDYRALVRLKKTDSSRAEAVRLLQVRRSCFWLIRGGVERSENVWQGEPTTIGRKSREVKKGAEPALSTGSAPEL